MTSLLSKQWVSFVLTTSVSLSIAAPAWCASQPEGTAAQDAPKKPKHEDRFKPKPKEDDGYYSGIQYAPVQSAPATSAPPASGLTPAGTNAAPPVATNTIIDPHAHKLFLWKASRGGETVYLLGTIHTVSNKFFPLRPEIENAYLDAKKLVVEIKADPQHAEKIKEMLKSASTYPAPDHLSKHLSPETKRICDEYFSWAGEPMSLYEQMKPWMLSMALTGVASRRQGFEGTSGIDMYLLKNAAIDRKPVIELETAESQVKLLDGFPEDIQDKMLRFDLLNLRNALNDYKDIEQVWKAGDADKLDAITRRQATEHPDLMPVYNEVLSERNTRMADHIDQLPKDAGPYMVAVGAAHMVGDNGLVALLQSKGFSVEQVVEKPQTTASTTFGASRMQKFRFADGECSMSFPGKPTMSYSDQMGTRSVQYSYPDLNGVYLLQYFNTPQAVPSNRVEAVYDKVASLLSKDCKPGQATQQSIFMSQGAARQIDFVMLPFKAEGAPADSCARVRLLASGKHLYMIGAFGRKAWLNSPVVTDYLNSLALVQNQTSPFSSASKAADQKQRAEDAEARKRKFEQDRQEASWRFQRDSVSNGKKWQMQHGHGF